MANVLIRGIPDDVINKLKMMAKNHNRSLQQELKAVLENTVTWTSPDIFHKTLEIRKKLQKKVRRFTDSTDLLREDRTR